jgi:predicted lysophospholipase L1 biosynthesis ABC-type transport system permease subunit
VLSFSRSVGRHGAGHRASETVRERLSTAMDDQAAPTWAWWLAMSAVWCAALVVLSGLSTLLGSVLLTGALSAATLGTVVVRTLLRVAGRTRDHRGPRCS